MDLATASRSHLLSLRHYLRHRTVILPCAAFFLLSTLLVSPVGEFALNDDWIFAKVVETLLDTGTYRGHPYLNATFIVQAYWGALFCKVLGFSFTSLRISTLVLGGVTLWGVAQCALILGLSRSLALLCAAVVAVNPIFFNLSYSYMTDVPFLAATVLAGCCFMKALQTQRSRYVLYGNGLAVMSFFIRQFGVVLPVAFALTLLILHQRRQVVVTGKTLLGFLLPWLAAIALFAVLVSIEEPGSPVFLPLSPYLHMKVVDALRHLPVCLCYLGLFCLPLGMARVWQLWQKHDRWSPKHIIAFIVVYGVSLWIFALPKQLSALFTGGRSPWLNAYPERLPLLLGPNILQDLSLGGPTTLPEPNLAPTVQIHGWWWIPTLIALFAASLLSTNAIDQLRRLRRPTPKYPLCRIFQAQELFLLLWIGLFVATAYNPWRLVMPDRYLLPAIAPCALLLAREISHYRHRAALRIASFGCAVIFLFTLVGQQDFLIFQQASWTAAQRLVQTYAVPTEQISAMATFNGWYNNEAYMARYHTRSWWDSELSGKGTWATDDTYRVVRTPLPGYTVIDQVPYFSILGMRERQVSILKRQDQH